MKSVVIDLEIVFGAGVGFFFKVEVLLVEEVDNVIERETHVNDGDDEHYYGGLSGLVSEEIVENYLSKGHKNQDQIQQFHGDDGQFS